MVKVAVAGGSGRESMPNREIDVDKANCTLEVALEIIDALLASKKHDITILSRRKAPEIPIAPEIHWHMVEYDDKNGLIEALHGTHTLLSFVQILSDPDQNSQKNLIDAAIAAGVKRFAPSEYGSKGTTDMAWWRGKEVIREYLAEVNAKEDVLEYTLFQPGLFLDYLAYPYKTAKHVNPLQTVFDFANRRAMVVDGYEDAIMTLTTVSDVAAVVARAVEYAGKWPMIGGIRGNRVTFSQVLDIGRKVRGNSFEVAKAKVEDLEAGELKTSWGLDAVHHSVPKDQSNDLLKQVSVGILLSCLKGAWDVSAEFNQTFPDYEFSSIEDFLRKTWEGKL
ncbi:conserved hypothetical protein [Talaromyces stipitatus ATCC 10500]|uniref:NmrA-like domain-containing protein n=1 Tax=Talaromyces stipitatus (strain ATCC 10500 / CBS 375.48 / QM 6759 / NRRL 1006) TaxID=441959 RepID=B8M653_TALSN|nr:uncharacterized protein TSTA_023860 [Talaromyces stipitatus ATCC 10500]EED19053.1 conserved hypothetical protein [Talaromyces stipitatus ATCC 10500]